ncbi:MAG: FKBP-type peptidyl-prolyl cis-trans isomerase [Urechidicola sp.]|nr:FKBP-type peptidyl-prolyl cis-trans isomerase [Urechidicola sp.]
MKVVKLFVVVVLATSLFSCNQSTVANKSLETELDSVSYAIGLDMAMKLKANFSEVDKDLFIQGYRNGIDSTNVLLEEADLNAVINGYFAKRQQLENEKKFEAVKKEGEDFLEANKSNEGVQVTESGLQYIVMKEGGGAKPTTADRVKVHYHGTLIDGTVFDSSVDRGQPYDTGVTQVIRGWIEGLQLMPVGSKYKFFIPQELAYGANPRQGGPIKPYAALVFEVELLEILK